MTGFKSVSSFPGSLASIIAKGGKQNKREREKELTISFKKAILLTADGQNPTEKVQK